MRSALVTGHAGFVGGHIWRRLLADGWECHGVDIDPAVVVPPACDWEPWEQFHGDCRAFFAESAERYDLIVHCAAVVGGRATIEGQPMAVATDLAIDSDFWQFCLRTRPGRAVFFSSSAAYPTSRQNGVRNASLPEAFIDLNHIEHPDQTYGLAKLVGEIQAAHVRAEGVPVTVIRPFSGYGEDQSEDYPFPAFIHRAAMKEDPFTIWGDGQQVRDWIHIDDIVDLTLTCVDQGIDGPINACTGRPTSFDQLARIVCGQAGYEPELHHLTDAPSGVRYRVGDPTLMNEVWRPKVTIEDGVARALDAARMAA